MGIAGNKNDLHADSEVDENEAMEYAKSVDAEFELISAKDGTMIDDFFVRLVTKYVEANKSVIKEEKNDIKLDGKKPDKKNKKCC